MSKWADGKKDCLCFDEEAMEKYYNNKYCICYCANNFNSGTSAYFSWFVCCLPALFCWFSIGEQSSYLTRSLSYLLFIIWLFIFIILIITQIIIYPFFLIICILLFIIIIYMRVLKPKGKGKGNNSLRRG